jgi:hypothetical protein
VHIYLTVHAIVKQPSLCTSVSIVAVLCCAVLCCAVLQVALLAPSPS